VDERGSRIVDDTLLILLNAHHEPTPFVLPAHRPKMRWGVVLDTREAGAGGRRPLLRGGTSYEMEGRSLVLLCLREREEREREGRVEI
jgi:glycogen operon protein